MTSVEIPSSELIHFKEQVKKWLTIDQQIAELESKLKDLKKIRNKELEPQVTDFMVKFKINDLNTENGKIKCSTRNTKKGLTAKYIQEKLTNTLENNELVDKAMENILENREVVTTYKLAKVKVKGS
tara:strand:+ start:321 stop:701 length:381 start_codon:yes stop_codon:yes gene_type:complete